jgi:VWFA-related protein
MRLVALVVTSLCITLAAQEPAFRGGTRLVRVDVSVLDSKRRPVRDLTEVDFQVFEGNRQLSVRAFQPIGMPSGAADPQAALANRTEGATARLLAPQSGAWPGDVLGRLLVLVLDDDMTPANPKWSGQAREIARAIVERKGENDRIAVRFTRAGRRELRLTSDRAELLGEIGQFAAGGFLALPPTESGIDEVPRFRRTMDTLTFSVESLAQLTDRQKVMVYVGPGIPINQNLGSASRDTAYHTDFVRYMSSLYRLAERSNVAVYTFDPTGADGLEDYAFDRYFLASQTKSTRYPGPPPLAERLPGIQSAARHIARWTNDFAASVADNTGGRAFMKSDLFEPAVDQMFIDTSFYYLLAIEPPNSVPDSKFHEIRIKVSRPGVQVRARRGYYYGP